VNTDFTTTVEKNGEAQRHISASGNGKTLDEHVSMDIVDIGLSSIFPPTFAVHHISFSDSLSVFTLRWFNPCRIRIFARRRLADVSWKSPVDRSIRR
jgi:hypothetical protein